MPRVNENPVKNIAKLKNGFDAKKEILKSYTSNNMLQALQNAKDMLNFNASSGKSDARKALNDVIDKSLEIMRHYYTEDGSNARRIGREGAVSSDNISNLQDLDKLINEEMPKAIDEYRKHLMDQDKRLKTSKDYLNASPNSKYIMRHVACDTLDDVILNMKDLVKRNNQIVNLLLTDHLNDYSLEDVLHGRDGITKNLAGYKGYELPNRTDKRFARIRDVLHKFADAGNLEAKKAYNTLINIDLEKYYKTEGTNGFAPLTKEQVAELQTMSQQIISVTGPVVAQLKNATPDEINKLLIPEAADIDNQFNDDAMAYRNALVDMFTELDNIGTALDKKTQKAKEHPGVYTLPTMLKTESHDEFLDSMSLDVQIDRLMKAMQHPYNEDDTKKKKNQADMATHFGPLRVAEYDLTKDISQGFEQGPDGFYVNKSKQEIDSLLSKYRTLENALNSNEKDLLANIPSIGLKEAESALKNIRNIVKTQISSLDKASKEYEKYTKESHENKNLFAPELLDPNPKVKENIKAVREDRINKLYQKDLESIGKKLEDPLADALITLETRLEMVKKDRFFALEANKKAGEQLLGKNQAVLDELSKYYQKENGGFTNFADNEQKQKLVELMREADAEINKFQSNQKLTATLKDSLGAISGVLKTNADVLDNASIAGKASVSAVLDAGKFGNPSLKDTLNSIQGFDRFDWKETDQKNDHEAVMYHTYINPVKKIRQDLERLKFNSSVEANGFTDAEKKWIKDIDEYMLMNFDQNFINKWYTKEKKYDEYFQMEVEQYPVMTGADQEELKKKFDGLEKLLDSIAGQDAYKNRQNKTVSAFLDGLGTYARTTNHRLQQFNTKLNLPVFTAQEAMSGSADTSEYNFRNELERFERMHNKPGMVDRFAKAKILLTDEQKWEDMEHGVRKKQEKRDPWYVRLVANRNYQKHWDYVRDYNDLTYYLEMLREFEKDYFRCDENGEYRDLPRTGKRVLGGTLMTKIRSVEDLAYVYEQVADLANMCGAKAADYNQKAKDNEKIPQEYINAMDQLRLKATACRSLVSLDQSKFTKPDSVNIMEMLHSDPEKRKNMWKVRMNNIFHRHREEEGQIGSYRNLEHFQEEQNSQNTYHGKFYDLPHDLDEPFVYQKNGGSVTLSQRLDDLFEKYSANATEEGKKFAKKLLQGIAEDPDMYSKYIPTVSDMKKAKGNKEILLQKGIEDGKIEAFPWWENPEDNRMMENLLGDISKMGISRVDAAEREKNKVKYGEDLRLNALFLSNISEALHIDEAGDGYRRENRLIPKAAIVSLRVPGENENEKYRGLLVDNVPDKVMAEDGREVVDGVKQTRYFNVITGKELLLNNDIQNYSIRQFNNPDMIRDLANLQAMCYLCNAPMPKVEDLKFAQIPVGKDGTEWKAKLMGYEPKPVFLEEKDFEGKVKLEDLAVLSGEVGGTIKALYNKDEKKFKENCKNWVENNILKGINPEMVSPDTMKRMSKAVQKNVMEMSSFLNDKTKSMSGVVADISDEERQKRREGKEWKQPGIKSFKNGIHKGKILITNDFESLTIDKLSLKKGILQKEEERTGKNLFTQISDIPERRYSLEYNKTKNNGLKTEHKSLRAYDGIKRVIEAVNIEAVLADFGKEDDSYWLHKNSKEAKKVMEVAKAMYDFQSTGHLKWKTKMGDQINIGIQYDPNQMPDNGTVTAVRNFLNDAQLIVQDYIKAKTGIIFDPKSTLGKRRWDTAHALDTNLGESITTLDALQVAEPKIHHDALENAAQNNSDKRKKVNLLEENKKENKVIRKTGNDLQKQKDEEKNKDEVVENNKPIVRKSK